MLTPRTRRRIEIDADVYTMLEAEARWLHIPVANLATMIIAEDIRMRPNNAAHMNAGPVAAPSEDRPIARHIRDAAGRQHLPLANGPIVDPKVINKAKRVYRWYCRNCNAWWISPKPAGDIMTCADCDGGVVQRAYHEETAPLERDGMPF